jgi:hypothetical protein
MELKFVPSSPEPMRFHFALMPKCTAAKTREGKILLALVKALKINLIVFPFLSLGPFRPSQIRSKLTQLLGVSILAESAG